MARALKSIKTVVLLLIAAFVVLVAGGIYTALNAAPASTISTSHPKTQKSAGAHSVEETGTAKNLSGSVSDTQLKGDAKGLAKQGSQKASSQTKATNLPASKQSGSKAHPSAPSVPAQKNSTSVSSAPAQSKTAPAPSNSASGKVWVPASTTVVFHPATYKEVPVYTTIAYEVCNTCGYQTTSDDEMTAHLKSTHHAGWHEEDVPVQTGTKPVIDTPAWSETVTIPGYYK